MFLFLFCIHIPLMYIRLQTKPIGYRISQHMCDRQRNQTPHRLYVTISKNIFKQLGVLTKKTYVISQEQSATQNLAAPFSYYSINL